MIYFSAVYSSKRRQCNRCSYS